MMKGVLSLDTLETLIAVCSVGLGIFVIPGDTPETIAVIMVDELAIGIINHGTTVMPVLPVSVVQRATCGVWRAAG